MNDSEAAAVAKAAAERVDQAIQFTKESLHAILDRARQIEDDLAELKRRMDLFEAHRHEVTVDITDVESRPGVIDDE